MAHDFKKFPELTNSQMQLYYFDSPHKQITEDFRARVVKVHDGDTITLSWKERNFLFPLRFINIAAAELNEAGGIEAQSWLEKRLLDTEVDIIIDKSNRVEKWGRLLGKVISNGIDVGEEEIFSGHAVSWENRKDGKIPDFNLQMEAMKL
jgi:endonuclease YncB( thermonuclease family)